MNFRILALAVTLGVSLSLPVALASGKAGEAASVSFHLETDATDNPKMTFPQLTHGETRHFRRVPEIAGHDIAAFSPFPADDGVSYGVMFQLKPPAARRLSAITATNQGRWMISQVGGRVVDGVLVDRQVDDGMIIIWKGITLADIQLLDKAGPRIGAAAKKK